MAKRFFFSFLVAACSATHISRSSYGKAGYGNYDVHHFGNHYDSGHKGHGKDYYDYHVERKANSKSHYGSSGDDGSHSSGGQHEEDAKKHAESLSNYGKDLKIKTYGYFDYKYIRPQYHVEKFHSEEKHANKYGADAHSQAAENNKDKDYYRKGYDDYYSKYGRNGAHYVDYKYGASGRGYDEGDHHLKHEVHKGGHNDYGHKGYDDHYDIYYHAPHHYDYYGHPHGYDHLHHDHEYY